MIICDDDDDDNLNFTPSTTLTKMLIFDTLDKPSQKFYTRTRQNARASPGDEDVHHRRKVESYDCNDYNQKREGCFELWGGSNEERGLSEREREKQRNLITVVVNRFLAPVALY